MTRPVKPRDAASIVIVDERHSVPKILMGRRPTKSKFIPDAFVFPGGKLDPQDRQIKSPTDLKPHVAKGLTIGERHSMAKSTALAHAVIRETYEETGYLLGTPGKFEHTGGDAWERFQAEGLAPSLEKLEMIARAITPNMSPIRFHARFLIASAADLMGTMRPTAELEDLGWYTLSEIDALPTIDVTDGVLGEVRQRLSDTTEPSQKNGRNIAFFTYRNEILSRREQSLEPAN